MAAAASAQPSLDADLDRAAARYEPAATAAPDETDALAAQAGEHYRAGRVDEAVAALDRAASGAYRAGATGRAFELSLTAAEAVRAAGRLDEAAERFQHAALRNTSDPRAAAAHHAACNAAAAALDATPATAGRLDAYEHLLRQHVATWPDAPTAADARWGGVELLARRGRWQKLIDAARDVGEDEPHYQRSRELLVAAHAALLSEPVTEEQLNTAWPELLSLVFVNPTQWPDAWTPLQREAALCLARGSLKRGADGVEDARRLLRQSLDGRPTPDPRWERRAAAAMVVASLAVGDPQDAARRMAAAYDGPPDERGRLFQSTQARVAQADGSLLAEADRLAQSVAALVSDTEPADARDAAALVDAGRFAEALALQRRLAAQRPDDRTAQLAYARLLARSDAPGDRDGALGLWRRIEARSEPSSEGWFEARLARLRLMAEQGQTDDARKLLEITRLLAPTLGGEALRAEFEALGAELKDAPP